MTEQQIRQNTVAIFEGWKGLNEADGSHMQIINIYNSHTPLARGYKVKSTDAWCAVAVSAVAIQAGLTDIIPTECGCGEQIKLFQAMGRWQENDGYVPQTGDVIYYDWDDNGKGDNTGWPDHVGMVVSISGNTIKVIEGNKSDVVGYREITVNARYIRGYGLPDYASKAIDEPADEPAGTYTTYTVDKEDTLWALAERYLGSGSRYKEIMTLNGLTSDTIVVGQVLKIPGAGGGAAKPANPYPVPTRTIYRTTPTMTGDDVLWVQWELNQAGYNVEMDEHFGPDCDKKLRAYQAAHGLEVDGRCGPATRACMQAD